MRPSARQLGLGAQPTRLPALEPLCERKIGRYGGVARSLRAVEIQLREPDSSARRIPEMLPQVRWHR